MMVNVVYENVRLRKAYSVGGKDGGQNKVVFIGWWVNKLIL